MDDGGHGVIRIKPLGAGGGGGESSAHAAAEGDVTFSMHPPFVQLGPARFTYPSHVIAPAMDNEALHNAFMPPRIQAFLDGVNVNVMAYGQVSLLGTEPRSTRCPP